MPARELQAKDVKLIQYLNEAYGKEKHLETALTAHIQMTTRAPYKKRLQQHLKETKAHGREVSKRIRALGGKPETVEVPGPEAATAAAQAVQNVASRAAALAQGPLHVLRGTGEQEKLLKNAKTQFQDEAEEIATYFSIETLANVVGDKETAKVAKAIRREEERMRDFLGKLIPQLTKAVAQEEIPAAERRTGGARRRRSSSSSASGTRRSSATKKRASTSRSTARKTTARKTTARKPAARKTTARKPAARKSASTRSSGSRSRSTASRARSTSSRSSGSRSSGSRSGGSRSTARKKK